MKRDDIQSLLISSCVVVLTATVVMQVFVLDDESSDSTGRPYVVDEWDELVRQAIRLNNADGRVRILEFADLECPFCREFHINALTPVLEEYGTSVSAHYLHFPLPMHQHARGAAEAAECAAQQGAFGQYVAAVFHDQQLLGVRSWTAYAEDAGIADTSAFQGCLKTIATSSPRIDLGLRLGNALSIPGTPTVLIDGWLLPQTPAPDELRRIVEALLAGDDPF